MTTTEPAHPVPGTVVFVTGRQMLAKGLVPLLARGPDGDPPPDSLLHVHAHRPEWYGWSDNVGPAGPSCPGDPPRGSAFLGARSPSGAAIRATHSNQASTSSMRLRMR